MYTYLAQRLLEANAYERIRDRSCRAATAKRFTLCGSFTVGSISLLTTPSRMDMVVAPVRAYKSSRFNVPRRRLS